MISFHKYTISLELNEFNISCVRNMYLIMKFIELIRSEKRDYIIKNTPESPHP